MAMRLMNHRDQKPAIRDKSTLRRSPRIMAAGDYKPDEDMLRHICYKETPVRIFKNRKRRGGEACGNLIKEFNLSDSQKPETSPQHISSPSRWTSVVMKMGYLSLVFLLVVFCVCFSYTCVTKWLVLLAGHSDLVKDIELVKHAMSNQGLKFETWIESLKKKISDQKEKTVQRPVNHHRADDVGMADYALESLGASVISSTETYKTKYCKVFGISLWCRNYGPETVIQPGVYPGQCWAFRGNQGYLLISLSYPVRITHVTLDHIPVALSCTGHTGSAPRDFAVYGMMNEKEEGDLLGTFTYDQDGEPVQTFKIPDPPSKIYSLCELRILSNWGHPKHTCVYRFRVHSPHSSSYCPNPSSFLMRIVSRRKYTVNHICSGTQLSVGVTMNPEP